MWSVTVGGASTFAPSEPILLFDEPYAVRPDNPAGASAAYDVTADGRFLMVRDLVPPTTEVRIVTGFHQQLERVAPIK